MANTLAVFIFGLILSISFYQRLSIVLLAALAVRFAVPMQAVSLYFKIMHPSFTLVLAAGVVLALFKTQAIAQFLADFWFMILCGLGLMGYIWTAYLGNRQGIRSDLTYMLILIILPIVVMAILRYEIPRYKWILPSVAWVMALGSVSQVVIGQMQLDQDRAIFWTAAMKTSWWWNDATLNRAVGTVGHGLQLGLMCALTLVFAGFIKYVPVRLALIPVMIYGTIIGSARTAFIIAIILSMALIVISFKKPVQMVVSTVAICAVAIPWFSGSNQAFSDFSTKLSGDDGPSTQLRVDGVSWFSQHYHEFFWTGYLGDSDLRTSGVLKSSLENGYFISAMTFGTVFMALYALWMGAWTLVAGWKFSRNFMLFFGGCACMVSFASTGSFMMSGVDGTLLWFIVGAALGHAREIPRPVTEDPEDEPKPVVPTRSQRVSASSEMFV